MFGKNTSDDIFVDFYAKSERDDVCDARTAIAGIAPLQFDDGRNEFPSWTLRSGTFVTFVAEQATIFAFDQCTVEFEQSRWFDDYRHGE